MKRSLLLWISFIVLLAAPLLHAAQSTITEAEGNACLGDDRSRKQTEQAALTDARRNAAEAALTYLRSETRVKDSVMEQDIIAAWTNASVKILNVLDKAWYRNAATGDCYRMRIRAEVIPDERALAQAAREKDPADDPSGSLQVRIWADKKQYQRGEKIRLYLKGNKPFYARVLYRDAGGNLLQILPNPYRNQNYFQGGVVYEIPSGDDRFDLEISPPFGEENILLYAGTSPLGDLRLKAAAGIYEVETKSSDVAARTRGVRIETRPDGQASPPAAGFVEEKVTIRTER